MIKATVTATPADTQADPSGAPRRLVYLCAEYPSLVSRFGGIAVSVREEARWFVAQGHDVTVICQTDQAAPGHYRDGGVAISVLPVSHVPKLGAFYNRLALNHAVRRTMGDRPGLVVCPDYSGPLLIKRFRQPLIVQLHGCGAVYMLEQGRTVSAKEGWFEKKTIHLADGIQAYSEFIANRTDELFGFKKVPIRVIPHPVDVHQFHADPAGVNPHRVLFTGSLSSRKGLLTLAAAMKEVFEASPEATLEIVGADHQESGKSMKGEFLARVPSAFHSRVQFTGQLPRSEVALRMRRAGVFVIPTRVESFGLVVLEAMASGRPVVASARAAIPEIVRDGQTGLLADPDAPTTFAHAILALLSDPARGNAMGAAGRQLVLTQYSPDPVYRTISNFHNLLIH